MRPEQRRRIDRFLLVIGALTVGAVALAGAFAGDTERIGAYWTHAHVDEAGGAEVVEVIDYDFGSNRRRGVLRQIPDVTPDAAFTVSSPTAPDPVTSLPWWSGTELRIGDPATTISNRHRYTISYPHDGLVFGPEVSWNAVGDGWDVVVHDVTAHLTSDRDLVDPRCDTGPLGATGGCRVEVVEPGHLVVHHDEVTPGRFLTVSATLGGPVAVSAPVAPNGPAPDPGAGWRSPAVVAALAALLGAAAISPVIRRLGREWMWDGGAVDAAFGPRAEDAADTPTRRVDHEELMEMTTIEFEAPRELSAALGGVVHLERVTSEHQTAWLLESAIRDEIELDTESDDPTITRGPAEPNPSVGAVLTAMFGARRTIPLEKYDPQFAAGWKLLHAELDEWRAGGNLWDVSGRRRRRIALVLGWLGLLIGAAGVAGAAAFANRWGDGWLIPLAFAAVIAGLGLGAALRAWELRVRTAEGSALWIRIESFRRFLHDSEAEHVERAAEMGLLRQYTAWAVALGEVDRWERAVEDAVAVPGSRAAGIPHHTSFAASAPLLAAAVSTASTAPSSSGGGGGGGSGGGGGGGGGGSW